MALKTRQEYINSLRDGREIYWDGERITDITTHPKFRIPIEIAARDFDYDDPYKREILTYVADDGERTHRIFQVPRTEADLQARIALGHHLSIVGGVTAVFMALLNVLDEVAQANPQYAQNIERMYQYARANDLRAAEVITDAKGDRSRKAHEQDDPDLYVRIVDRNEKGIVVRGAKLHITAAALVNELVVMPTKAMRPEEKDYAVAFSIPVNTPGVKIINRSFAHADDINPFDFPFSARASIPEGFVIFDDVLVPWDRVFLAGESKLAGTFARSLGLWERTLGLLEASERARIMVGLAQLVTEQQGKEHKPEAQNTIAEMICYAELIRMSLDYAVRHYEKTPSGMVYPNVLAVNVAKYYYAANYHDMVKNIHDLGGGLVLTLPTEADLRNEASGKYLRKYLHTRPDVDVEERMRVYNAIRDLTADAYGGWHQVTTIQAGGGLYAQRVMMNRLFDMQGAKAAAKSASGARLTEAEVHAQQRKHA
ncbi:MAG: 4-hydroxyphenylacetate 3-hydroxylase N-terminal domain-containing protein [Candidatus Binatia bacterium]